MKKFFLLSILVILLPLIFSFTNNTIEHAFAQNPLTGTRSLAGDEVCGATAGSKCTLDNAKSIVKTTLYYILGLGTILLGVVIIFRILAAVKAYYVDNNAGALKKAGSDLFNSIIGFIVIVLVIGGVFVALLTFLGVKADFLKVFSDALVPTAYAQAAPCTPGEANCGFTNPLGVSSLYDFVLLVVRLFIRWFIYPGIIVMWIWSGFAFVTAQGRPEQLKKAKSWLPPAAGSRSCGPGSHRWCLAARPDRKSVV